jgi:AraC-like DNA-binding protein
MKIAPFAYQISFHNLHTLFKSASDGSLLLKPSAGKGSLQVFDLEHGLQAKLWDFRFNEGLEMYCDKEAINTEPYFTIAYFLNKENLQFANSNVLFHENTLWDTLFISSTSSLRMYIPPAAHAVCLNISFSKKWLNHYILEDNPAYKQLKNELFESTAFSLLEYMNASEKKLLMQLIDATSKKLHGSFYIKAVVLKMICDFFYKLKEKSTLSTANNKLNALLTEAEKILCSHITGAMPNLKTLACQHGISEVSLKRHFKQCYGVNMSSYFINKKMEYAQQLMDEKNINSIEAAHLLGYTNVSHFITMFKKYAANSPNNIVTAEVNSSNYITQ